MFNSKLIDEVTKKAGIQLPDDKRERFMMKRMIQSVYQIGLSDGRENEKKVNTMISKWAEK